MLRVQHSEVAIAGGRFLAELQLSCLQQLFVLELVVQLAVKAALLLLVLRQQVEVIYPAEEAVYRHLLHVDLILLLTQHHLRDFELGEGCEQQFLLLLVGRVLAGRQVVEES